MRITIALLATNVLLALFFDKSAYTQEKIDWCAGECPYVPMNVALTSFDIENPTCVHGTLNGL